MLIIPRFSIFNFHLQRLHLQQILLTNKGSTNLNYSKRTSNKEIPSSSNENESKRNVNIDVESFGKCQLEFNCGVGGVEAALFANELYEMYRLFAAKNGWIWRAFEFERLQNGLRFASVSVQGEWCYAKLQFEGGVHRVQRTPLTDKSRIHTSTASLAVLPEPDKPEVMFSPKEIRMESMRASGPGGSNVNANSTAVRLKHLPTGITLKVQDERFLHLNEKIALQRLSAILLKRQIDEINRKYSGNRKMQVASLDRADKIRTYNYKDDRITDHRIKQSFYGIEEFMKGGEKLEQMNELLMEMFLEEREKERQEEAKLEQRI